MPMCHGDPAACYRGQNRADQAVPLFLGHRGDHFHLVRHRRNALVKHSESVISAARLRSNDRLYS
jgi:hypothetical protein